MNGLFCRECGSRLPSPMENRPHFRSMNKRKKVIAMLMTLVLAAVAIQPLTANSRSSGSVIYAGRSDLPSAPAVTLLASGNFFMNLNLTQTVIEEGEHYTATANMIIAGHDGKRFTCNTMNAMGMDIQFTQVFDGTESWEVDLAAKTYTKAAQASEADLLSSLEFVGQGQATVNGQKMIYDRYKTISGETVTFFIHRGKLAVLGMETEGEISYFSVMELRGDVPDGLMFEIPADYQQVASLDPFGTGSMMDNYVGDIEDYLSDDELQDLKDLFGENFDLNDLIGGDFNLEDMFGGNLEDIYGNLDIGGLMGGEQ